jgi:tmRNA-binding protein
MSGDLKSITYWGADFKDSFKTADDLESWILQYVVPKLKDSKWPKPHTKVINDVLHELKVEILNNDPATKDR